jgi:hypothetical protein
MGGDERRRRGAGVADGAGDGVGAGDGAGGVTSLLPELDCKPPRLRLRR